MISAPSRRPDTTTSTSSALPSSDSRTQRLALLAKRDALYQKAHERNIIVALNNAGIPEIRIPDTHPHRWTQGYIRPVIRILVNGEDANPPTDLVAFSQMLADCPELVDQLGDALQLADAEIAALLDALAGVDKLPIADEATLKAAVRKALWDFRDASPDAQADRAIDLIRRYLPAPEIIERERYVSVPRTLVSPEEYSRLHAAIAQLKIVDDELVGEVAMTVLTSLDLIVQEAKPS